MSRTPYRRFFAFMLPMKTEPQSASSMVLDDPILQETRSLSNKEINWLRMAQRSEKHHKSYCPLKQRILLRECTLLLTWKLAIWEISSTIVLISSLSLIPNITLDIRVLVCFLILKTGITIYLFFKWKTSYYQITPEKVMFHKGVFSRHEEVCAIKNIESIDLKQSLLGKIFHFGTIKLYAPTLNHRILMFNIHHPRTRMKLIEKLMPKTKQENMHRDDLMILPHPV